MIVLFLLLLLCNGSFAPCTHPVIIFLTAHTVFFCKATYLQTEIFRNFMCSLLNKSVTVGSFWYCFSRSHQCFALPSFFITQAQDVSDFLRFLCLPLRIFLLLFCALGVTPVHLELLGMHFDFLRRRVAPFAHHPLSHSSRTRGIPSETRPYVAAIVQCWSSLVFVKLPVRFVAADFLLLAIFLIFAISASLI